MFVNLPGQLLHETSGVGKVCLIRMHLEAIVIKCDAGHRLPRRNLITFDDFEAQYVLIPARTFVMSNICPFSSRFINRLGLRGRTPVAGKTSVYPTHLSCFKPSPRYFVVSAGRSLT